MTNNTMKKIIGLFLFIIFAIAVLYSPSAEARGRSGAYYKSASTGKFTTKSSYYKSPSTTYRSYKR
jgi:hypothetical protein